MRSLLHNQPREADWVRNVLDRSHRPGAEGAAVHDRGIKLGYSVTSIVGTSTRIEGPGVFQHADRHFDGIQAGSSVRKYLVARFNGFRHRRATDCDLLRWDVNVVARTTVNDQNKISRPGRGRPRGLLAVCNGTGWDEKKKHGR